MVHSAYVEIFHLVENCNTNTEYTVYTQCPKLTRLLLYNWHEITTGQTSLEVRSTTLQTNFLV